MNSQHQAWFSALHSLLDLMAKGRCFSLVFGWQFELQKIEHFLMFFFLSKELVFESGRLRLHSLFCRSLSLPGCASMCYHDDSRLLREPSRVHRHGVSISLILEASSTHSFFHVDHSLISVSTNACSNANTARPQSTTSRLRLSSPSPDSVQIQAPASQSITSCINMGLTQSFPMQETGPKKLLSSVL